jgi:hypothetical protein
MTRRIYTDAQPKIIRDLDEAGRSGSVYSARMCDHSAPCREAGLHGCTFGADHDAICRQRITYFDKTSCTGLSMRIFIAQNSSSGS